MEDLSLPLFRLLLHQCPRLVGELCLADGARDATARPDPVHGVPLVDADERGDEAIICELSLHGFTRVDSNGEWRHLQARTVRIRNICVSGGKKTLRKCFFLNSFPFGKEEKKVPER